MRSRLRILILAVLLAVVAAGCSSETTVVERADRAEADDAASSPSDDDGDGDTEDVAADDSEAEDAEDAVGSADDSAAAGDAADTTTEGDEQGFGLGGAEQLAALLADCEAGSDPACDILFQLSAFDSIEETVALTCGGRSDVEAPFCTQGIETDGENLFFDIASPGLDAIVEDCETGDMTACDFLYFRSPLGSRFEELGNTCGGRTEVALPDCRTFFDD